MVFRVSPETPVHRASTVVVLRDSAAGPEVFMLRRHQAIAFMAGAHVFPGGRVDATDYDADDRWCDGIVDLTRQLSSLAPGEALAHAVAAARELFEEAGVLLARSAADGAFVSLSDETSQHRFAGYRHDVHAGRRALRSIVEEEGL